MVAQLFPQHYKLLIRGMCVTHHIVQIQRCLLQLIPGCPDHQQDFGEGSTRSCTFLILPLVLVFLLRQADAAVQSKCNAVELS